LTIRALSPRRVGCTLAALAVPLAAPLAAVVLLAGCNAAPPPATGTRLFASDLSGGAKLCTVPTATVIDGKEVAATMTVGNTGGWCGITVAQGGKPYAVGLLTARAAHGAIFVHTVGDATRIDYTPDTGFTGSDTFTVKLIPGGGSLRVAVTVVK
jgi:hypothetical protein